MPIDSKLDSYTHRMIRVHRTISIQLDFFFNAGAQTQGLTHATYVFYLSYTVMIP
jgi:hypothetical protein